MPPAADSVRDPAPPPPPSGERRGRLTVLLGGAPGCGKTTRLARAAADLAAAGIDVVVGWGRLGDVGVASVPPLTRGAHGLEVEEMDVDAILRRRPRVCVVDDLAHANAPGGRRLRRHEDVEDLVASGIDVITAMDVRHVESLGPVVRRATGAEARDTVPDSFLRRADEVVCIDTDMDEVRRRRPDDPTPREALVSLRELALREVAEWIARRRAGTSAPPASPQVGGRVLACVASASPRAEVLLRRAAVIAGRLNTDWFVAHVERPGSDAPVEAQRVLARAAGLAQELGAEVVTLRATDPVAAVVDFARSHGVAHVVVGRSERPAWRRLVAGTFVSRLLTEAYDLDVHVIATPDEERP
jgi:two-component system sensor histidine kinase KdpD